MVITEQMIERAARALAKNAGQNPDQPVYYQPPGYRRDPIDPSLVGGRRHDGSVIAQWPTMPLWKWEFSRQAAVVLEAAMSGNQ